MAHCGHLLWNVSLQESATHKLAKICCEKFVLKETIDSERISTSEKDYFINYRNKVLEDFPTTLNHLYKQLSVHFPRILKDKVRNAVINWLKGYYEALLWENNYKSSLPFTILNAATAGKYEASNFITATGDFDDLAWVKLFVIDHGINICFRFQMACFYCLEDEINNIWSVLKTEGMIPCLGSFEQMKYHYSAPVVSLAYKLAYKVDDICLQSFSSEELFPISWLYVAIEHGHEYAVRSYWKRYHPSQKEKFLRNTGDFYDCIIHSSTRNCSGITHFLYSLFSLEHKNLKILVPLLEYEFMGVIWSCLLNSQFYKCALEDILSFPESIPVMVYMRIFNSLATYIEMFNHPIQKMIFKTLWNHLTRNKKVQAFEKSFRIVHTFMRLEETDLLETMIIPLPYHVKDKMLFLDCQVFGIEDEVSKIFDYDTKLRYLLLFMLSDNFTTQKKTLRGDAYNFLERLKNQTCIKWLGFDGRPVFFKMVDDIQISFNVLNDVLNRVSELHLT